MSRSSRRVLLEAARLRLQNAGISTAAREARWLMEEASGLSGAALMASMDDIPGSAESVAFAALADRRAAREPFQYVVGHTEFMGRTFHVKPGVLIPRPETEELVTRALGRLEAVSGGRVLDVGTGSGCIAVSLAAERPDLEILALDISAEALHVARGNAARNNVRVSFLEGDILAGAVLSRGVLSGGMEVPPLDMIVSNPPYVPIAERDGLEPEVRDHEPALALFVDGDALQFYRALVQTGREVLVAGGTLLMEIHADAGGQVMNMLEDAGYARATCYEDAFGRQRIVEAVWPGSG